MGQAGGHTPARHTALPSPAPLALQSKLAMVVQPHKRRGSFLFLTECLAKAAPELGPGHGFYVMLTTIQTAQSKAN